MRIGNGVLVCVPTSETQVQTAHEGDLAVNQTEFLVMSPV
jgi:hypothetical protein